MLFKLLSELTVRELRTVFRRSGKRGIFQESNAIVQLTVYLFRIGQDPFTYRFPISGTEDNVEATLTKTMQFRKELMMYPTMLRIVMLLGLLKVCQPNICLMTDN